MSMGALKQYIDLYREHRGLIDANSAAPLNALRPEAYRLLQDMKLPAEGDDNYENCDLEAMLAPITD